MIGWRHTLHVKEDGRRRNKSSASSLDLCSSSCCRVTTARTYQDTGLSPSDYHHSRSTCRDAYIDECTIMDTEEGSHAAIVRWSDSGGRWCGLVLGRPGLHTTPVLILTVRTRIKKETDQRSADSHAHIIQCVMKGKAEGKCAALEQWVSFGGCSRFRPS